MRGGMIEENERQAILVEAFNHVQAAIALLDRAAAPGNIAAHLDLAANQLHEELAPVAGARPQSIGCQ
jgi:hypothetical protein